MAFVGILSQIKLLFGSLVIQLVWYILKQFFTFFSSSILLTELSRSVWENLDLTRVYRPRSRFSDTDLLFG